MIPFVDIYIHIFLYIYTYSSTMDAFNKVEEYVYIYVNRVEEYVCIYVNQVEEYVYVYAKKRLTHTLSDPGGVRPRRIQPGRGYIMSYIM